MIRIRVDGNDDRNPARRTVCGDLFSDIVLPSVVPSCSIEICPPLMFKPPKPVGGELAASEGGGVLPLPDVGDSAGIAISLIRIPPSKKIAALIVTAPIS